MKWMRSSSRFFWISLLISVWTFSAIGLPSAGPMPWTTRVLRDTMTTASSGGGMPGDCDGDGTVSIGEVQKAINMFLGLTAIDCSVDVDGNGTVSIGEVQKVINAFLGLLRIIHASASTGGQIAPSGAVLVNTGASQAFAFTADTGYALSDVLVDSVSVGSPSAYTFESIQADHTIHAVFEALCEAPVIASWTADPAAVYVGNSSALAGSITGPDASWTISVSGGTGGGAVDPSSGTGGTVSSTFTGTAPGDVAVLLTATNPCSSASRTVNVTVALPPPSITAWTNARCSVPVGGSTTLSGAIAGEGVSWTIQQIGGSGSAALSASSGSGTSVEIDMTGTGGGAVLLRLHATNAGGVMSRDLTVFVDGPGEDLQFAMTPDTPGPYLANGVAGTTVSIVATDGSRQPIPGLCLGATLLAGDDVKTPAEVTGRGDGVYRSAFVSSAIAGENRLAVWVTGAQESSATSLEFTPGDPSHFWVANLIRPLTNLDVGGVGYFEAMLKDPKENLLDPVLGELTVTSEIPNVSIQQTPNAENALIEVRATLMPGTGVVNNDWYWAEGSLMINGDGYGLGYPYVNLVQIPGPDPGTLGLRLVMFDPGVQAEASRRDENFANIFVAFPWFVLLHSFLDPVPGDDCVSTVIQEGDGFRIQSTCATPHFGMTPLVDVFFPATAAFPGVYEGTITGSVVFPGGSNSVGMFPFEFWVKPPKSLCVTIWLAPGVPRAKAEADVEVLKDRFRAATGKCCPNFSFDVRYETISQEIWNGIDKNGDGKLQEGLTVDPDSHIQVPTSEEEPLILMGDVDCINVYYVPGMTPGGGEQGSLGEAFAQSGDTNDRRDCYHLVVNGGSAPDTTLAHEIAHCLGDLPDNTMPDGTNPPASNLMWQTKNDRHRTGLTQEQCDEIRRLNP